MNSLYWKGNVFAVTLATLGMILYLMSGADVGLLQVFVFGGVVIYAVILLILFIQVKSRR